MFKTRRGRVAAHAIFQVGLVALLSLAASQPAPSFKDVSWDIVLFLTPLGILKNLIAESPVMRSFYVDISKGQGNLASAQMFAMLLIFCVMLYNAYHLAKFLKTPHPGQHE